MELLLPFAELDRFDATVSEVNEGSFAITGASRSQYGRFTIPDDPAAWAGDGTTPGKVVQYAIRALAQIDHGLTAINRSRRLSEEGREEDRARPRGVALETLLQARIALGDNIQGLAKQQAQRYAIPLWDADNVATTLIDQELRQHIRSLQPAEHGPTYQSLTEGSDTPLMRAVLRSPIKLGNLEKLALEGWKSRIDREDPVGRLALDRAERSMDWAERNVAIAQELTIRLGNYSQDQIYQVAGRDNSMRFFGLTPATVESIERRQIAQKLAAA